MTCDHLSVNKPSYKHEHFLSTAKSKTTKLCKLLTRMAVPVISLQRRLLFNSASTMDTLSVSWLSSTLWCAAAVCKESCKTDVFFIKHTADRTSWEQLPKWKEVTQNGGKSYILKSFITCILYQVSLLSHHRVRLVKVCNIYWRYQIGTHILFENPNG